MANNGTSKTTELDDLKLTPWDIDNDTAITKSSVDNQDEPSIDDIDLSTSSGRKSLGGQIAGSLKQLTTQGTIGQGVGFINRFGKTEEKKSIRPNNTDGSGALDISLDKIKNKKYKNVSLSSKFGLYNNLQNLVGTASGLFVGTLGKGWSEMADDATSAVTKSFPSLNFLNSTVSISKRVGEHFKDKEDLNFSSLDVPTEDLLALSLANYYTILTSRPGFTIRAHGGRTEYITNEYKSASTEILSEDEFDKYKKNFKFINKAKTADKNDEEYDTGAVINNDGVLINAGETQVEETIINSKIRKEVLIKPKIGIFDTLEDFELHQQGDGKKLQPDGAEENFPRVTKALVFNRVNDKYRDIGGLYIEPFYSNGKLQCYEIPFEFNPTITENASTAQYAKEELLGRIISLKSYVSSDSGDVSIEATYFATSNGKTDGINNYIANDGWKSGWMSDWDTEKLKEIEQQYRSLTLPYIEGSTFIRPPIVRIKLRSASSETREAGTDETQIELLKVGDLFRYPKTDNKIQITKIFDGETRDKRYVVTSVQISPLEHFGNSYVYSTTDQRFNTMNRNGFKVTVNLSETTRNFLDLIPSYGQYVDTKEDYKVEYFDVKYNPKFINEDKADLWSCLNNKLMFSTKWVNDTSKYPIIFHDPNAHYLTDNNIQYTQKVDLTNPNKNISKEFSEYYNDLVKDGKSTIDIIKMLYGTKWIEREDYVNWMYGNTSLSLYNECNGNFLKYMELMEDAGLSIKKSSEFRNGIENSTVWKKEETFKEYFIKSDDLTMADCLDFGLELKGYIETLKSKYPEKLSDIFIPITIKKYNTERSEYMKWYRADKNAKYTSYETYNGNFKAFADDFKKIIDKYKLSTYSDLYCLAKKGKWKDSQTFKDWKKEHKFDIWLRDYFKNDVRRNDNIKILDFLEDYDKQENLKLENVDTRYKFYNELLTLIFESGKYGSIVKEGEDDDNECYISNSKNQLTQFINDTSIFVHISDENDPNYSSDKNIIKLLRKHFKEEQIFILLFGGPETKNVMKRTESGNFPPKYPEGYPENYPEGYPESEDLWSEYDHIVDESVKTLANNIKVKYRIPRDAFLKENSNFNEDTLEVGYHAEHRYNYGLESTETEEPVSGSEEISENNKMENIAYILKNIPETDNSDLDEIIEDDYPLNNNMYEPKGMQTTQEQMFILFFDEESKIKNKKSFDEE